MTDAGWHELEVCDSTSDELARLAAAGAAEGTVVLSATQRRGRGRQGREWSSGDRGNLYASLLLRPPLRVEQVPPLSLVTGIALADVIRDAGVDARLKWPNDVVVGHRKLAGILAEASSRGGVLDHVIVGVGVNLVTTPDAVSEIATSIKDAGGRLVSPSEMMHALVTRLQEPLASYIAGGVAAIRADYLRLWRDRDRRARAVGGVSGIACDISSTGALVIEAADGTRTPVVAGEVEIDYA